MPSDTPFRSGLGEDDFAALDALQKAGDPRFALARKNMTPDDVNAYVQHLSGPANTRAMAGSVGAAALGGGAMLPGVASAVLPSMADLGNAAKIGVAGYGISKLPAALRPIAELVLLGKIAKGSGGRGSRGAAAAEGEVVAAEAGAAGKAATRRTPPTPALDPKQMGGMSDEDVIAAFKNGSQPPTRTIPPEAPTSGVRRRTPAGPTPVPADIERRTRPDWLTQDVAPGPFANPKANLLRPDESLVGLVRERYPELGVKGMHQYPRPTGDDQLSNAVRQRHDIAVKRRSPK